MNFSDEFDHKPKNDVLKVNNINTWTHEHERILLILHKYANIQYKKYHETYNRYKKKLGYYRIPIIIITGVMGLLSISNSSYIPKEYNSFVSLAVGITNVAVTTISLIEIFKEINVTKVKSLESYIKYKQINDELSLILRLPYKDRSDTGIDTINKYFKMFEKCQLSSPVLQINTKDLFELDTLEDVTSDMINTDPDKKKWSEMLNDMGRRITGSTKIKKYGKNITSSFGLYPFPTTSLFQNASDRSKDVEIADSSNTSYTSDISHSDINNINDLKSVITEQKNPVNKGSILKSDENNNYVEYSVEPTIVHEKIKNIANRKNSKNVIIESMISELDKSNKLDNNPDVVIKCKKTNKGIKKIIIDQIHEQEQEQIYKQKNNKSPNKYAPEALELDNILIEHEKNKSNKKEELQIINEEIKEEIDNKVEEIKEEDNNNILNENDKEEELKK